MSVYYKNGNLFKQSDSAAFDTIYEAGAIAPHSGIYRCVGCGRYAVSTKGNHLPPQNHHQHTQQQGRIRWQLVAAHE